MYISVPPSVSEYYINIGDYRLYVDVLVPVPVLKILLSWYDYVQPYYGYCCLMANMCEE